MESGYLYKGDDMSTKPKQPDRPFFNESESGKSVTIRINIEDHYGVEELQLMLNASRCNSQLHDLSNQLRNITKYSATTFFGKPFDGTYELADAIRAWLYDEDLLSD